MISFWSASVLKGEMNLVALIPNLLLKINKLLLFNLIASIQYLVQLRTHIITFLVFNTYICG